MNYFFYVEDSKSGREMFEYIIKTVLTRHTRVRNIKEVRSNHYVVESGFGYPSMIGIGPGPAAKNRLGLTIDEINRHGSIDILVLCLDTDGESENKVAETEKHIKEYENPLCCDYAIFVQNICAETWLLGINALFPSRISSDFAPYRAHYNVSRRDPEYMKKPSRYKHTDALYHFDYLRVMSQQNGIAISKSNCKPLFKRRYIDSLFRRVDTTNHLLSLKLFLNFLRKCR